ncbi:MAG: hypothetical protein AB6733_07900 [Clostridiaceae bacterium]
MGVSYYIILEKESKEIDLDVCGKGIAKDIEKLDKIAKKIGVIPLSNFYSINEESMLDLLGEDIESIDLPPESWFDANHGLKTVQALLDYVQNNNLDLNKNTIVDLMDFERILKAAVVENSKWYLAMDF